METDFSVLTNKISYKPLQNSILTSASPIFPPFKVPTPEPTTAKTLDPEAWPVTMVAPSSVPSALPVAELEHEREPDPSNSPVPTSSSMWTSSPITTTSSSASTAFFRELTLPASLSTQTLKSLKPWSPWPGLKPITKAFVQDTTSMATRTTVTTSRLQTIPSFPNSPTIQVVEPVVSIADTTEKPAVQVEIVLERPSVNKRRMIFPSTTVKVAKIFIQRKSTQKVLRTTAFTLAPTINTKISTNAIAVNLSGLVSAVPTIPGPSSPGSTKPFVNITYRTRLVTGTESVPRSTQVPNSTSSSTFSSSPFLPTNSSGSSGRVEEVEASVHFEDASVGGVVTAAVLGTLVVLGVLTGLGIWAWNIRLRVAAGATVSAEK